MLRALLDVPTIRRRLAALLGQANLTEADLQRLAALAALHDLGKANVGFQNRIHGSSGPRAGHIGPLHTLLVKRGPMAKLLFASGGLSKVEHLLRGAGEAYQPWNAILAHHGDLPDAGPVLAELWRPAAGYDPIASCRELVEAVLTWFPLAAEAKPPAWPHPFGHAFAGLVTLADWLGSDTEWFPLDGADVPDGTPRFAWALARAHSLIDARALRPDIARAAACALSWDAKDLLTFADPSPAQSAMMQLAAPPPTGRTCLVEAETGSGKTEAALLHFLDLFRRGEVDGMYFALPARAAAVQIHGRIQTALQKLLGPSAPPVTLAVPGYLPRQVTTAPLPDAGVLMPDERAASLRDAHWSSERPKRFLASWVAVGTIDQALLGGVRVRHATLRSGAMLRLLLVVDEVHASDRYMTAILRNLLDQHRRAGGHALLMSATLGSEARAILLQTRGRMPCPDLAAAVGTSYPATWSDATPAGPLPSPDPQPTAGKHKDVQIVLEPDWRDDGAVVALAVAAARQGARVLIIRNTVRSVVGTQIALEVIASDLLLHVPGPGGAVSAPHHARYATEDRKVLDAALEGTLGRSAARTQGSICCCSQTAEQSLDIDADLLITDLCPADVLLQRIGRLHRHMRDRPDGFGQPRCVALAPSEDELAAAIGKDGEPRGAPLALGLVYRGLVGVLATRIAFAGQGMIQIPGDNRRLVEAATNPHSLLALAESRGGGWMERWKQEGGANGAQAQEARHACLDWQDRVAPFPKDERITVRLGVDDRTVELPPGAIGPFGTPITAVLIPGRWLRGVPVEAEATVAMDATGGLTIRIGAASFMYDRLGLRPS